MNKAGFARTAGGMKSRRKISRQKLPVAAAKQGESTIPPNPIPCNAFTKNERGNWYVKGPVTIDLGNAENKTRKIWKLHPSFLPSAVSVFTRPFRRVRQQQAPSNSASTLD